jgi:hypothetical protein
MDKRRSAEYGLGCAATAINFLVGGIQFFFLVIFPSYAPSESMWLGVFGALAVILNFVGFRVSSKNLTAGGIIMIVTALPLLVFTMMMLGLPAMPWWLMLLMSLWLLAQLLSIASGIKCFVSASGSYDEQEDYVVNNAETPPHPEPGEERPKEN